MNKTPVNKSNTPYISTKGAAGADIEPLTLRASLLELGLPVLLIVAFTLIHLLVGDILFYKQQAIEAGQWWRIWTGQWAHLNVNHTLMNLAGFVMIYVVFRGYQTRRAWFASLGFVTLWTGAALFLLDSDRLHTYAGLSGALHGFLIIGLCFAFRHMPWLSLAALAVILGRVYMEQQPDYDTEYIREVINGAVYVNAHLYGLLGGVVFGVIANARGWSAMLKSIRK